MKNSQPRVLVGIVTSDRHRDLLKEFGKRLTSMRGRFDVIVVDNTGNDSYLDAIREAVPGCILVSNAWHPWVGKRITDSRNICRQYAMDNDYTHLMTLDSDIMVRPDTLYKMLVLKLDVVVKPYALRNWENTDNMLSVSHSPGHFMGLGYIGSGVIDADTAGLGCALISRRALETTRFRNDKTITTTREDILFFRDLRAAGYPLKADLTELMDHRNKGWADVILQQAGKTGEQLQAEVRNP